MGLPWAGRSLVASATYRGTMSYDDLLVDDHWVAHGLQ